MKNWKIFALVGAMLLLAIGVDLFGCVIAWVPFIWAMWLVLSDKELMKKWNDLMEDLGA